MERLHVFIVLGICIGGLYSSMIDTPPKDMVFVKGAPNGTTLMKCLLADNTSFSSVTWTKSYGDCLLCKVTPTSRGATCSEAFNDKYSMDADNKFNLLSKKVVDFSFADRYTCKVSPRLTNDKFLGVIGGYGDETFSKSISVTGNVSCPGALTVPTKTNVSLNCTLRHKGPAIPVMMIDGQVVESFEVLEEDDFGVITHMGRSNVYQRSPNTTKYVCSAIFRDPLFVHVPPCEVTVTAVGAGARVLQTYHFLPTLIPIVIWLLS